MFIYLDRLIGGKLPTRWQQDLASDGRLASSWLDRFGFSGEDDGDEEVDCGGWTAVAEGRDERRVK